MAHVRAGRNARCPAGHDRRRAHLELALGYSMKTTRAANRHDATCPELLGEDGRPRAKPPLVELEHAPLGSRLLRERGLRDDRQHLDELVEFERELGENVLRGWLGR